MTKQMPFYWMNLYYITIEAIMRQSFNKSMLVLADEVLKGFDNGLLNRMILIDLQKVFDTIDYEILLQKLKAIRFSESTIALWFKSYISERIFLAKIEKKLSDFGKISCGVPQGSTVGPLWILVTVNNVREAATSTCRTPVDSGHR